MAEAGGAEIPKPVRFRRGLAEHQRERRAGIAAGAGNIGGSASGRGDSPRCRTGRAACAAALPTPGRSWAQPAGDGPGDRWRNLAKLCRTTPGAPTPEEYAEFYASEGWRVDAAALATMAACGSPEQHGAMLGSLAGHLSAVAGSTARHLQTLIHANGQSVAKRAQPIGTAPGRLVVFADGLRMDVAQQLARETGGDGD